MFVTEKAADALKTFLGEALKKRTSALDARDIVGSWIKFDWKDGTTYHGHVLKCFGKDSYNVYLVEEDTTYCLVFEEDVLNFSVIPPSEARVVHGPSGYD